MEDLQPAFYQVLQGAALARVSTLWHTEVLLALATLHKWYFFSLADVSEGGHSDVMFLVKQCFFHTLVAPRFPLPSRFVWYSLKDVENIESHRLLVLWMTCDLFQEVQLLQLRTHAWN